MPTCCAPCPGKSSASTGRSPLLLFGDLDARLAVVRAARAADAVRRLRFAALRAPGARRQRERVMGAALVLAALGGLALRDGHRLSSLSPRVAAGLARAQRGERRIRSLLVAPTRGRVAIRATARAQPPAFFLAQWLDRQRERDDLADEVAEVDLVALVPARLQFVAETHPPARERRGGFRLGGDPRSRRLEHESEGLAERVTIADEAAPALELERAGERPLDVHVVAHAMRAQRDVDRVRVRAAQLGQQLVGLAAPRLGRVEVESGRAVLQPVDVELHG